MERRKNRRIPFSRAVSVNRNEGDSCLLEAEDISLAGIRLRSEIPVDVGERLELQLGVDHAGHEHVERMQGQVRHVELTRNGYTLGVGFIDVE